MPNTNNQNDNAKPSENEGPLTFMEEKKEESYKNVYEDAIKNIDENINYYNDRIPWRRLGSIIIRSLVLFAMAVGVALPMIAAGIVNDPSFQFQLSLWGYYALVLAGLIFALDQYFMFSRSWMRFTITRTHLNDIKQDFIEEWNIKFQDVIQMTAANYGEALKLANSYKDKARVEVEIETNQWVEDLTSSITKMENRLSQHEKTLEKKFETLVKDQMAEKVKTAKTTQPNAIRVNISNPTKYTDNILLALDGPVERQDTVPIGTSKHIFAKLPIGIFTVMMTTKIKNDSGGLNSVNNSDVVTLAGDEVKDISF